MTLASSDWRPLLDLMRADSREPRFERPDRPAHTYAQTTRRAWVARLQTKDAAPTGCPRRDAA